jgi:hypothetical protein
MLPLAPDVLIIPFGFFLKVVCVTVAQPLQPVSEACIQTSLRAYLS